VITLGGGVGSITSIIFFELDFSLRAQAQTQTDQCKEKELFYVV
jgi:hypothetical protein